MTLDKVRTAIEMGIREYARTPLLLALVVFLPVYMIATFARLAPDFEMTFEAESIGTLTASIPDLIAVLMTPIVVSLIGGIAGMYVMQGAKQADGRLMLAGYRPSQVIIARIGLLAVGCLLVTLVSVGTLWTSFEPAAPAIFLLSTFIAALTYATVGVLVGVTFDVLLGVYIMLFAPTVDILLFQNPMGTETVAGSTFLPGHYVTTAVIDAGFQSGFNTTPLLYAIGYLVVLVVAAAMIFYRNDPKVRK